MAELLELYEFYWDCGRQGSIEGRFFATKEDIKKLIGLEAHFGEALGKHSEIYGTIEDGDIYLVTDDADFLERAFELKISLESGYNPMEYIDEDLDDIELDEDDE